MMARLRKLLLLFNGSDWVRFGLIVGMMLGAAGLEFIGIGAVPAFVAMVGRPSLISRYPRLADMLRQHGIVSASDLVLWGSLLLIVLFAVRTLYMVLNYYIQDRVVRNRQIELSSRLFEAYLRAPHMYHLRHNSAEMLRNATQGAERIATNVLTPILLMLRHGLVIAAVVALVTWREPLIGLLTLVCLGATGLSFLAAVNRRMKYYGEQEHESRARQYQCATEAFSVLREIRLFAREIFFLRQFHDHVERVAHALQRRDTIHRSTWPIMELIVVAILLGAAIAMISTGKDLDTLMPTLALFTVALARLKGCATELVSCLMQVRYQMVSVDAVYEDLHNLESSDRELSEPSTANHPFAPGVEKTIEFQGVFFRYGDDLPYVLEDISLRIEEGASIAFVGPTGSGKSTLVDLLCGFLQPDKGCIQCAGVDIQTCLPAWQASIGYIPQEIALLDTSIAANIALGLPPDRIDTDRLWAAVRAAQLEETIDRLPHGLDTLVGERGTRLSGGQCQRVGIARALYTNPDILIMDEGTSALDSATERAVVEGMAALKGERTIIMIAHRLTTVRHCDRIFCLAGGRIEAAGTYEELLLSHPRFAVLAGQDPESAAAEE